MSWELHGDEKIQLYAWDWHFKKLLKKIGCPECWFLRVWPVWVYKKTPKTMVGTSQESPAFSMHYPRISWVFQASFGKGLLLCTGIDLRNFFWLVYGRSHMINDSQSWVGRTNFRAWIPPGHPLKSNPDAEFKHARDESLRDGNALTQIGYQGSRGGGGGAPMLTLATQQIESFISPHMITHMGSILQVW